MAVLLKFTVNRENEGAPKIEARIVKHDYQEDDIEVLYARLAMRYLGLIEDDDELEFEDNPHIESVNSVIAFSRNNEEIETLSAEEVFDGLNDSIDPDDELSLLESPVEIDNSMAIGFKLFVETTDIIGGMATGSVVAATKVHELLIEARDNVTLNKNKL